MTQEPDKIIFSNVLSEPEEAVTALVDGWPEEALRAANLAALGEVDGELAAQTAGIEIPDGVKRVVALDGSVTYQTPYEIYGTEWLGGCSVPWAAGQSLVERIEAGAGNLAMAGLGSGHLVRLILERAVRPGCALLVWLGGETGVRDLRLVFGLHDFSEALRSGRLVLLGGENAGARIERYYQECRGSQIVTTTVMSPWLSRQENGAFNKQITEAMQNAAAGQKEVIGRIVTQWEESAGRKVADSGRWSDPKRLSVVSFGSGHRLEDVMHAGELLAGFAGLGARVTQDRMGRPDEMAFCARLERLAGPDPDLIVLVNQFRGDFSTPVPAGVRCLTIWTRGTDDVPSELGGVMGADDAVVCYREEVLAGLRANGAKAERSGVIFAPVDAELYYPAEDDERVGDLIMVSDRYSDDAERYQIHLPTHQALWGQLVADIRKSPAGFNRETAGRYLNRAQQCGVELREKELRDHFGRLAREYLGRTVLKDTYAGYLIDRGYDLRIWDWAGPDEEQNDRKGTTWDQSPCRDAVAGVVPYGAALNRLYQRVKLAVEIEPHSYPTHALLSAVAAGVVVLVRENPQLGAAGHIGKLFRVNEEVILFDTPDDLVRKVRHFLGDEAHRREVARRARARFVEQVSARSVAEQCLDLVR